MSFNLLPLIDLGNLSDMRRSIIVNDRMQRDYCYERVEPVGRNFDPEFKPDLTPAEMLRLGVFGGKYMTDCGDEFPASWFKHAKLASGSRNKSLNYFGVDASQPLSEWRRKGWIHPDDPRGWFQWYCRYYMGRRMPREDARQIKRWKATRRQWVSFSVRASPVIFGATYGNGKRYCIGPMTVGNCERSTLPSDTSCPRKIEGCRGSGPMRQCGVQERLY